MSSKESFWWGAICSFVVTGLFVASCWDDSLKEIQNQAIEKGYAEIRVINGERKFQWK